LKHMTVLSFLLASLLAACSTTQVPDVPAPPENIIRETEQLPLEEPPTAQEEVAEEEPLQQEPQEPPPQAEPADESLTKKQMFDRGNELFAKEKYRDALRYFLAASKKGEEAPIFYNIGTAHFRLKEYAEAEAAYKKALELDPDYKLALAGLGKLCLAAGRDKEALKYLVASLRESDDRADVLLLVGTLYEKLGDLTASASALEEAVRLEPEKTDIRLALARVFIARGEYEKSLQIFKELVKRSPSEACLRAYIAAALQAAGRTDEAIDQYELSLKLGDSSVETYNRLGSLYYSKRIYKSAASYFRKAIDAGTPGAPDYINLAITYIAAEMHLEATEAARLAFRLDPESARACKLLGDALAENGDSSGALAAYAKTLTVKEDYAPAALAAGRLESKEGNHEKALKWFKKALEMDADNSAALRGAGSEAYALKKFEEASEYYRRLAQLTPNDSSVRNFLRHLLDLSQQEK